MIFVMLSLLRSPSYIFPHLYSLSYLSIILLYLQYFGRLTLRSPGCGCLKPGLVSVSVSLAYFVVWAGPDCEIN